MLVGGVAGGGPDGGVLEGGPVGGVLEGGPAGGMLEGGPAGGPDGGMLEGGPAGGEVELDAMEKMLDPMEQINRMMMRATTPPITIFRVFGSIILDAQKNRETH